MTFVHCTCLVSGMPAGTHTHTLCLLTTTSIKIKVCSMLSLSPGRELTSSLLFPHHLMVSIMTIQMDVRGSEKRFGCIHGWHVQPGTQFCQRKLDLAQEKWLLVSLILQTQTTRLSCFSSYHVEQQLLCFTASTCSTPRTSSGAFGSIYA